MVNNSEDVTEAGVRRADFPSPSSEDIDFCRNDLLFMTNFVGGKKDLMPTYCTTGKTRGVIRQRKTEYNIFIYVLYIHMYTWCW